MLASPLSLEEIAAVVADAATELLDAEILVRLGPMNALAVAKQFPLVARRRRGNQTSGAVMERPSARVTFSSSSEISTALAKGRSSTGEVLIPSLQ